MEGVVANTKRRDRRFRYSNLLLLFLQMIGGAVVATTMAARESYSALSDGFFGEGAALMGSWLADLLVRKEAIVLVVGLLVLTVWKEFRLQSATRRLLFNLGGIAVLMGLQALLIYLLYAPVNA